MENYGYTLEQGTVVFDHIDQCIWTELCTHDDDHGDDDHHDDHGHEDDCMD